MKVVITHASRIVGQILPDRIEVGEKIQINKRFAIRVTKIVEVRVLGMVTYTTVECDGEVNTLV